MAAAVATAVLTDQRNTWVAGNKYMVLGTLTISASPATYTTGGIACSLFLPLVKASRTPIFVIIQSLGAGTTGTLFEYVYIPGADASTGLLKIFTTGTATQAGAAELSNSSSIPADVSGDTITFLAIFDGQN